MKIDTQKLETVLRNLLTEANDANECVICTSVALGRIGDIQIQLTVTRDREDRIVENPAFRCVTAR